MRTAVTKRILKFDDSSEFPGQFVALDPTSGGYPYAVEDPTSAEYWKTDEEALSYAAHFKPESDSHRAFRIEPKVYIMSAEVKH